MNNKRVCKSRKKRPYQLADTIYKKENKFAEKFDKIGMIWYNDWIRFQTCVLLGFMKVITVVVTMVLYIFGSYGEFFYKV